VVIAQSMKVAAKQAVPAIQAVEQRIAPIGLVKTMAYPKQAQRNPNAYSDNKQGHLKRLTPASYALPAQHTHCTFRLSLHLLFFPEG